uniref:Putative polyprotein n=1 Tax=Albugo laibachii Nc14 TaxID=890382 RepID=F0WU47_9STRA|nr:putative polyprotein [Albugo laibachii Nc14]|eukprot:CCA24892.1 putative polyprotein [Albugo laibachii Nc14]
MYITTCTPPEIAYVVNQLSRFLENAGTTVTAEAFTDVDWDSNIDNRRSVSGVMVMIGNAPVVFKSKYQRTVALSSAEAEYMALILCMKGVHWVCAMLKDMGREQEGESIVWEDNQGEIALARVAGYHARTAYAMDH